MTPSARLILEARKVFMMSSNWKRRVETILKRLRERQKSGMSCFLSQKRLRTTAITTKCKGWTRMVKRMNRWNHCSTWTTSSTTCCWTNTEGTPTGTTTTGMPWHDEATTPWDFISFAGIRNKSSNRWMRTDWGWTTKADRPRCFNILCGILSFCTDTSIGQTNCSLATDG